MSNDQSPSSLGAAGQSRPSPSPQSYPISYTYPLAHAHTNPFTLTYPLAHAHTNPYAYSLSNTHSCSGSDISLGP